SRILPLADIDSPTPGAVCLRAAERIPFSGAVATFTNTFAGNTAADFTATIDWGDGTSSAGTVTDDGAGNYTVSGTHTYANEGNFNVSAVLSEDVAGAASATATGTASVRAP